MHRNQSVDVHQFAMVPKADIPRSAFRMQKGLKTAFDAGFLNPIFCEEILPGDTWNLRMTAFVRLATPLFPVMDNLYLDTFFFFVPNRLVWTNWVKFMGEQKTLGASISFTIPQVVSPVGGFVVGGLADRLGLPTVGQVGGGNTVSVSALPFRCVNLIYNEWFRDENLMAAKTINNGDGPDPSTDYVMLARGKRHDYFTSCLPFLQKGTAVPLPLTGNATVKTNATELFTGANPGMQMRYAAGGVLAGNVQIKTIGGAGGGLQEGTVADVTAQGTQLYPTNLYADLSTVTATTINALRLSFQIQKLLERDARGGTRYTELLRAHFGVVSPDARLQRPEYLGGGSTPININPVAQTTATGLTGGSTPLGNLSAFGTGLARGHGFTQSFTEHGYIIGFANVRADLTYQQGLRRHWSRLTRYDYYFPAFAMLGEQAVLNKEIYCDGSANDANVFGYQERWGEMRYIPSEITGLFRSTSAGTIDPWHLAQKFTALPTLNETFIMETPPVSRILAVGTGANGQQFLCDAFFDIKAARPLPMYSVPGLIDHF